jgi:anti-sigma factor RsiW
MTRATTDPCDVLLERLSAYLDGDLPAGECRKIERHSRTCARCASVTDDLRRTAGLCRQAGTRPLPAAVKRRAQQRIRQLVARAAKR